MYISDNQILLHNLYQNWSSERDYWEWSFSKAWLFYVPNIDNIQLENKQDLKATGQH